MEAPDQVQGDLFRATGVSLPLHPVRTNPSQSDSSVVTRISGKGWSLHTNTKLGYAAPSSRRPRQLHLDFTPNSPNVIRYVPRSHGAFMSMRVTSFFSKNKKLFPAAEHLVREGVCYVGDLTHLTYGELASLLGPHAATADEIVRVLQNIGIRLCAKSPWWARPRDYYA